MESKTSPQDTDVLLLGIGAWADRAKPTEELRAEAIRELCDAPPNHAAEYDRLQPRSGSIADKKRRTKRSSASK